MRRVLVVTIDGLLPEAYLRPDAHGLKVPTLRRLVRDGAYSDGARSVFPSLTYPSHTSIATGVLPAKHGVVNNRVFDPLNKNLEAWYWYEEDLKVPALWQLAERAGLRTALINWPVTVGAKVAWLVPEYWRARQPEDFKLVHALSTPGLLEAVKGDVPDLYQRMTPPLDSASVDIATHLLRNQPLALLLLHIWEVDHAQHHDGLWSEAASAAIENADAQLGRLVTALEQAGQWSETALVVASDHGFAGVTRQVNPGALLREAGLLSLDTEGKPSTVKAAIGVAGGMAYVYAPSGEDAALDTQIRALFEPRAGKLGSGIGRVFTREQIKAKGGDPTALLALEAEPGVYFGPGLTSYETPPPYRATHGYDPEREDMRASLLWLGPGVRPGLRKDSQLVDVAPTVAHWLGLQLPSTDGRVLE